jgi:CHASE2 domain-containing sensor protein/serine phosphatase RsbU (regulator of sigma subunit)
MRGGHGRPLGVLLLLLLLAALAVPEVPGLRLLRLAGFDAYQALAPRVPRSAPVVIVTIDEESLRRYGQWPWPRTWLARLVARLAEARPAAIGLDVLMPEPDRLSPGRLAGILEGLDPAVTRKLAGMPSNDAVLAETLRGRPVVLAVAGVDVPEAVSLAERGVSPVRAFGGDPARFVPRFEGGLHSIAPIEAAAAGRALVSVDPERGVLRRMPMLAAVGPTLMPGLALEMLRVAAGAPAISVKVGRGGLEAVGVAGFAIPTEPDGRVWLHYSRSDARRLVPASDVLDGMVPAERFQGRLVLVGATALGLSDTQSTPVTDRMPGIEVHAQLLECILDGALLTRPPLARAIELAMLAAGGVLLLLAVPRLRPRVSAPLLLGLILLALAGGFLAYRARGLLVDGATPGLGLAVLYTALLAVTLTETESRRRALRRQVERQREAAARLAGELEAARRIQMGTLPRPSMVFPGEQRFDLYARLDPAREVGGDLYDFFFLDPDHLFFLIGDVSGKGLPGSLFMAISKALYKSTALRRHGQVAAMMREADAEISRDNTEGLFVTALAGILDARTGALEYCSAGHEPPFLLPRAGRPLMRLTEGGGPPLCAADGFPYDAATRQLEPGDTLCLITDGITEAAAPDGTLYGRPRLEALLGGLAPAASAGEIGEAIRRDVAAFTGDAEASDDMAMLVLRYTGPTGC